tara:strand:+ start:188 stop:745 length:558 start_codon:yes stop_codon:yes gene_type:complete
MPTKKQTIEFINGYKGAFKTAGLSAPSSMSVGEVNKAVDKAVEKMPKEIANKWKKMKLISDTSPEEIQGLLKDIKKSKAKKMLMSGGDAPVMTAKTKPKAKVVITAKNFTSATKLGKSLPKNKSGFMKVKSVKKSTNIQAKSKKPMVKKGGIIETKAKGKMSQSHKDKIAKGVSNYHSCAKNSGC